MFNGTDFKQELHPGGQWTLAHGHLIGMGDIILVNPELRNANPKNQNGQVLTLDQFKVLIQVNDFNGLLDIPEADICDRSKGDALFAQSSKPAGLSFSVLCVTGNN